MSRPQPLVLVVEDDADTAALYLALLGAEGLEVVWCGDCHEAQRWMTQSQRPPDLVILDMRLPDGNGLELCRKIMGGDRGRPCPPIMVLSAHGDPRLPALSRQAGASAFLDKLTGLEHLVATAKQLLIEAQA